MAEESFLLVSLDEDKSKTLAQVLSNDTARRILDHLSKEDTATESNIAQELDIALSTVHYNMGLLVKSGLVENNRFRYSKKGKKIIHYSLSNKYVVIAPKKDKNFAEKLKGFLPAVLLSLGIAAAIEFLDDIRNLINPPPPMDTIEAFGIRKAAMDTMALPPQPAEQNLALFFLMGSMFALLTYFVWAQIIKKK